MASSTIHFQDISVEGASRHVVLVEITGTFADFTLEEIAQKFYNAIEEASEETGFLVDLKDMTFMSSSGIGHFIDFLHKIEAKKGKLTFANVPKNIQDVFNVVGFAKVCDIFPTLDEAKQAFV